MSGHTYSLEEVRDMVVSAAKECAPSRLRNGMTQWCAKHDVSRSHANEFVNGKRGPTTDILDALGLEWVIARKDAASEGGERQTSAPGGEK